jgi:DNA-binding NtrC family response regulator
LVVALEGKSVHQTGHQKCVYVVDDESLIASTLADILQFQGFDATPFSEPLEALKAAHAEAPDLLITDMAMPLLSGIELAIQVQEHCPNCRVLLFSGHTDRASLLATDRFNGHEFELVNKPIHPNDLLKRIQAVFEVAPLCPSV